MMNLNERRLNSTDRSRERRFEGETVLTNKPEVQITTSSGREKGKGGGGGGEVQVAREKWICEKKG